VATAEESGTSLLIGKCPKLSETYQEKPRAVKRRGASHGIWIPGVGAVTQVQVSQVDMFHNRRNAYFSLCIGAKAITENIAP
jgi:hypothetical protein